MIMKYDKMVAITQAESQRKMNIAKNYKYLICLKSIGKNYRSRAGKKNWAF